MIGQEFFSNPVSGSQTRWRGLMFQRIRIFLLRKYFKDEYSIVNNDNWLDSIEI